MSVCKLGGSPCLFSLLNQTPPGRGLGRCQCSLQTSKIDHTMSGVGDGSSSLATGVEVKLPLPCLPRALWATMLVPCSHHHLIIPLKEENNSARRVRQRRATDSHAGSLSGSRARVSCSDLECPSHSFYLHHMLLSPLLVSRVLVMA